jgi:hypothetical protein
MSYILSDDQYETLRNYFELAMTAISDEEQHELVFMEKPLREMLRQLRPEVNSDNLPE